MRAIYSTQPALLDPSLVWTYSTSANVDGTNLKGFEIAYRQPFRFLPSWLGNINETFTLTFEGVNLANEYERL